MLLKIAAPLLAGAVCLVIAAMSFSAVGQNKPGIPKELIKFRAMATAPDEVEFVPDEVVVKFEDALDASTRTGLITSVGGEWKETGWGGHFDVVRVPVGQVEEVVAKLSHLPGVVYAEPNYLYYA